MKQLGVYKHIILYYILYEDKIYLDRKQNTNSSWIARVSQNEYITPDDDYEANKQVSSDLGLV